MSYKSTIRDIVRDRREFICRLKIANEKGQIANFDTPHPEQLILLDSLEDPNVKTIVIDKPRQIGGTTLNCADTFYSTFVARDPIRTLITAHENDATDSIFSRIRFFHDTLPKQLQRELARSNRKEHVYKDTGAGIRCMTAGGRGQGRSWTYQRLVAEELAFWPNARDVWASLTSTMHDGPHNKTIIISTANGPGDLFHEKVLAAQRASRQGDPSIKFLFFRWADHDKYRLAPPKEWEPTHEDFELAHTHGLDWEQMYWRHQKIHGVNGIGELRFRREYPLTIEDGFILLTGSWFSVDYLNEMFALLPGKKEGELRIYHPPEKGMTYAIGADPSWCNGGDFAVAQVLDRRGRQCATLSMNRGGENLFAERLAELSHAFNRARVLCESNTGGAGRNVIRILTKERVPLWKRLVGNTPKDWTTTHGNKEEAYGHLRQVVNGDNLELNDHATIQELLHIREENGTIEGQDGYHDDHADALVLAEWNRRTIPSSVTRPHGRRKRYNKPRHPMTAVRSLM